jgi:tight adherence protein C
MNGLAATLSGLRWEVGLIALGGMVTVLLMAVALRAMLLRRRDEVLDRIDRLGQSHVGDGRPDGGAGPEEAWGKVARPFAWMARPTQAAELSRLRGRLVQAGLRTEHAMEIFLASKILLAAAVTLAFLQINARFANGLSFPMNAAVAVWLCGATFFLPNLWLGSRIKTRQVTIESSLPDAMDLLVTCVEAGLGLDAALSRVADEMGLAAPMLAHELQLTFLEIQAGVPRREAFRRLAERTGVEDLRQLSAVLAQTEIFGTSIARALRVHAESMRIKRMYRAEEKAAMVGVKMTLPLVICILPSLIAVILGPAMVSIYQNLISKR